MRRAAALAVVIAAVSFVPPALAKFGSLSKTKVTLKRRCDRVGQDRHSVFFPLTVAHGDLGVLEVDILDAQAQADSTPTSRAGGAPPCAPGTATSGSWTVSGRRRQAS